MQAFAAFAHRFVICVPDLAIKRGARGGWGLQPHHDGAAARAAPAAAVVTSAADIQRALILNGKNAARRRKDCVCACLCVSVCPDLVLPPPVLLSCAFHASAPSSHSV